MRKLYIIIAVMASLVMILCGCSQAFANTEQRERTTVIVPTDNTVNGYREESNSASSNYSNPPPQFNESSSSPKNNKDEPILYYANTNSLKFHFSDCYHAKKIKNENLYITESREELIRDDYAPCLVCKP